MPGRHRRTQNRGEEPAGFVFLPTQNKIGFVCVLSCRLGVYLEISRGSSGPGGFQGRVSGRRGSEWSLAPHKGGPPQAAVASIMWTPAPLKPQGPEHSPSGRLSCICGSPRVDEDEEQTPQGHAVSTCCQTGCLLVAWGHGGSRSEWLSPWTAEAKAV